MLSPIVVKIVSALPESIVVKVTKILVNKYFKKYANIKIDGIEKLDNVDGPLIFICNHLSNADGLILDNIGIKPNSADKEAITRIVKLVRGGENLVIFPEGTRSRTGAMIEGKKGILLIARLTKAKIVPIGMYGTEILLPINKDGDMGGEKFNYADVHIKFGEPILLPKKEKDEDKHDFDDRSMNFIMKSIANLLPERYRGVYK